MTKRCVVCFILQDTNENRTFHSFPKDKERRQRWIMSLAISENLPKYAYICSDHFTENDFTVKPGGMNYLKKDAVPLRLSESSSLLRFPKDEILRKNWLHVLGFREDKSLPKRADICSTHFNSKDFQIKPGGRKCLKSGALPLLPSTQPSQEHSSNLSSVSSTNPVKSELVQNLYNLSSAIEVHIKNSESDDENVFTPQYVEEKFIGGAVTNIMPPKTEIYISYECEDEANVPTIEAVEETIEYLSDSSTLTAMSEKSFESDNPSKPEKTTTNVSKTFLAVEEECPAEAKRTTKTPNNFGDTDSSAQKSWRMAKRRISEQKGKIRKIQVQNRRLRSRVQNLQTLLKHLFHNYEFEKKS